jgi:hypothetical protein
VKEFADRTLMKKGSAAFAGLLFVVQLVSAQSHWESIILGTDEWRYLPAVTEPPAGWNSPGFNDSAWSTGNGGFGYGDLDDETLINPVNSLYLRKSFQVDDTSVINEILIDIDYDDAFVAYMNGIEIARSPNLIINPVRFNSPLTIDHEAKMYRGIQPDRYIFDDSTIVPGNNILAVQILNNGIGSSDLTGIIYLNAKINSPDIIYRPVPDWFREPLIIGASDLPLIIINTSGQDIPDEPKITATMGIIDNQNGLNHPTDTFTGYDGFIGIELRGSSSLSFEKKNYGIETRNADGSNNNVSLLGLPPENDWVLHGPYSDKSLMRNALAYYLGNQMGRWAPHTRFCELYIDNDYKGVYLLVEKVKRDVNRLNIEALLPEEVSGSDMSGGYILSVDRPEEYYWISPYKGSNYYDDIIINYIYPDYATMPNQQKHYIQNFVTSFENALHSDQFRDPLVGYRAWADPESFIDYFLINELSRNVDAYRLSTFFYKDKDEKLMMGPIWDFDLAFGNANYYDAFNTQGWMMNSVDPMDAFQVPMWWDRLRQDDFFNFELKRRWDELRKGPFQLNNIFEFIDSVSVMLSNAQERNFYRYPVLGSYLWPNYFVGDTYEEEIDFLKDWITQRVQWMDNEIKQINFTEDFPLANTFEIYPIPNPFYNKVTIRIMLYDSAHVMVSIYDLYGRMVYNTEKDCSPGITDFIITDDRIHGVPGIYIYEVRLNGEKFKTGKLIKY